MQTCAPVQTMTACGMRPLPRQSGLAGGYQCHPAVFRAVPPDPQHRTCHVPDAGLIVQREAEIDTFKPVPFYTVTLELPGFTVSGERMADKAAAQQLKTACQGAAATVKKVGRKNKSEKPPALYDLTTLQRDANRLLGFTAQQTLDYLQNLYEKKLCTYPRTDSRYLTSDMAASLPELVQLTAGAMPFSNGMEIACNAARLSTTRK